MGEILIDGHEKECVVKIENSLQPSTASNKSKWEIPGLCLLFKYYDYFYSAFLSKNVYAINQISNNDSKIKKNIQT